MDGKRVVGLLAIVAVLGALVLWLARPDAIERASGGAVAVEDDARTPREALVGEEAPNPTAPPSVGAAPTKPARADAEHAKAAAPDSKRLATVRGRLLDPEGDPVANARVYVLHAPDLGAPYSGERAFASRLPLDAGEPEALHSDRASTATSGADGTFETPAIAAGRVRLLVVATELVRHERDDLLVAADKRLDLGDVVLARGRAFGTHVRDRRGPDPKAELGERDAFADADVPPIVPSAHGVLARTDDAGLLVVPPLAEGVHELVVRGASGAIRSFVHDTRGAPFSDALRLAGDERMEVRTTDTDSASLPRIVRALPVDAPASPIEFRLRADGRESAADLHGRALLTGLDERAEYELRAANARDAWSDLSSWNPPVFVRGDAKRVGMAFQPDATLSVRVASDGGPLDGLALELDGALPRTLLDTSSSEPLRGVVVRGASSFEFVGVRPRLGSERMALKVSTRRHAPVEVAFELEPGKVKTLDGIRLRAWPHAELFVRSAENGRPIAGALVTCRRAFDTPFVELDDALATAVTNEDGLASIATWGIANSTFEIVADGYARTLYAGFDPAKSSGVPVTPVLVLGRGARVRVRVVDEDGHGIPAVRVERKVGPWSPGFARGNGTDPQRERLKRWDLERAADGDRAAMTDANGEALFPHVAAGQHAFHVQRYAPLLDSEWTSRELPGAGEVEFALSSIRRVRCDATLSGGAGPLAFARVGLAERAEQTSAALALLDPRVSLPPGFFGRANGAGRVAFENVYPGRRLLAAEVAGQTWRAIVPFDLGRTSKPFAVDLARERIAGVVVDEGGAPVPNAAILARVVGDSVGPTPRADALELVSMLFGAPSARPFERVTSADANGRFQILGVPREAKIELRAELHAHLASATVVAARTRESPAVELRLVLEPRGSVLVEVAPSPHASRGVVFAVASERAAGTRTAPIGFGAKALLGALTPGAWRLVLLDVPSTVSEVDEKELVQLVEHFGDVFANPFEALAAQPSAQVVTVVAGETQHVELAWR